MRFASFVPYVLVSVLPFGTAVQTSILSLVLLFFALSREQSWRELWKGVGVWDKRSVLLIATSLLMQMLATYLNPQNPERDVFSFALGFLPLCVMPLLVKKRPSLQLPSGLNAYWGGVLLVWGCVVLSQAIWGWKISGSSFVTGESFQRSQGFYSHPLTLAYVSMLLWPLNFVRLWQGPRDPWRWLAWIGNLSLLTFSLSRTAQAIIVALSGLYILSQLKGRLRLAALAGLVLAGVLILATDNPVSKRFQSTLTPNAAEKMSDYPDDRVAFWHAHWEMVKETPILGHGIELDKSYRLPYYEKIGLGSFEKQYEAHNMYLQVTAQGGIIALILFVGWLLTLTKSWSSTLPSARIIQLMTLVAFALGGLTQNAFSDIEVRFSLTLLLMLGSILALGRQSPAGGV